MKRDLFLKNKPIKYVLFWLLSFGISIAVATIFLIILTIFQKQYIFEQQVIQLITLVIVTLSAYIFAYFFCLFTKLKGILCGAIAAITFIGIKICILLCTIGIGQGNIVTSICIIAAATLGGIIAANSKNRSNKKLGKLTKIK